MAKPRGTPGQRGILEQATGKRLIAVGDSLRVIARTAPIGGLEEALGLSVDDPSPDEIGTAAEDAGEEMADRLYLIGWVRYEDAMENPRLTYFCRERYGDTDRFTPARDCE